MRYLEEYNRYYINTVDLMLTLDCPLGCEYCFVDQEPRPMKLEDVKKYLEGGGFSKVFPFGGEPLLNPEVLEYVFENSPVRIESLITNGVLVPKNIDLIKKIGCRIQFSVDGTQKAHDMHRKYPNGKGSYADVMKGIKACQDNGIEWSTHGVVTQKTLPYYSESIKWYWRMVKPKGIIRAIKDCNKNTFQIIFEEEWTDKDIDIAIQQHYEIEEWVMREEGLTLAQRKALLLSIITRKGGLCGGGTSLLAVDDKMDIYPCHRVATEHNREDFKLGNVFEPDKLTNVKLYNSFHRLKKHKKMYSATMNHSGQHPNYMFQLCQGTNLQLADNTFYQSAKYNLMFSEVNRAIQEIIKRNQLGKKRGENNKNICDHPTQSRNALAM